jgi:hypothetical protein
MEVPQDSNNAQMYKELSPCSRPMWPGHEEPGWRILATSKRLLIWTTLDLRPRQLRDEGMSGVNQHAYIRLIYRRFVLLVP